MIGAALSSASSGAIAESGWEWMNPRPQGHDLGAVVADNGVMVAVGNSGSIIASSDGNQWRVCNGTTEYDLSDVIWANGLFVAVGGKFGEEFRPLFGVVLTSTDGFQWIERYRVEYFRIRAVVWDGARFVAVGKGASVLLSSDGITWSEEELELEIWDLEDVVWDGSRFVAVGRAYGEWSSYFTSQDALNWQETPFDCECDPAAITWGDDLYVVVGGAGGGVATVLVSGDAMTWEENSWEQTGSLFDVIHGDEGFVAVGNSGTIATSVDGYVWSFQDPPSNNDPLSLTTVDGGYLAVGQDGLMMTGLQGGAWEVLFSDSLELPGFFEIFEMAAGDGVVVGVGTNGAIIRSKHGRAWLRQPGWGVGYYNSVRRLGSEFWAVGDHGIVRSPDGASWELMLYDADIRLFDVAWNGSVFVAVGRSWVVGEDSALVATSSDGLGWAYQSLDTNGAVLRAVRWIGSRFVAVGAEGVHLTSPDGFAWAQHPMDDLISLRDLEWNGDRLVAVGQHWETGRLILSSPDGLSWEARLPPDEHGSVFSDVAWIGDRFLAVGRPLGDTIFTSSDGVNWLTETTGTGLNPVSVGGDETVLYLTGLGGKIIRRIDPQFRPAPRRPERRVSPVLGKKDRLVKSVE